MNNSALPIIKILPYQDPVVLFSHFANDDFSLFLDSSANTAGCGTVSVIAVKPFDYVICRNGLIETKNGFFAANPWDVLDRIYHDYQDNQSVIPGVFQGGLAGCLGYEMGNYLEALPVAAADDYDFPDCMLGLYDLVMVFDRDKQTMTLVSQGWPETSLPQRYAQAHARLTWLESHVAQQLTKPVVPTVAYPRLDVIPCLSPENYSDLVKRAIEFIYAGDIFEVNLSQRFAADLPEDFDFYGCYQALRKVNPAPFSGFFRTREHCILSASPERFLQLSQGQVITKPIKGTRRRSQDDLEDKALAAELLASEKDRAENIMIVDLLRNDLAKVCDYASIQVSKLCALETFATVHHLVSTIVGKLRPERSAIDLLKATFPGGSITGAPKIRAMEIITELEKVKRGPYCGSLGYIGFNGEIDLSILIRSVFANNNKLYLQAGGAVVADSDPLAECQETYAKAAALLKVLG